MQDLMNSIPPELVYAVGFLILSNIGVIITLFIWGGKAIWWASRINKEVETMTKEIDAAHKNIRDNREAISRIKLTKP